MDRKMPPKANAPVSLNTTDSGASSDPNRRCKTCACYLKTLHPHEIGRSVSQCRRNPPQTLMGPNGPAGLAYALTDPELVCFDGWRPMDTPPGDRFQGPMVKVS